ncbi:MAG: GlxA family transcriptional regulator, partial [Burkholderiaceae bacterium]
MQRMLFIVYPGFELLDLSGPASVFNGANQVLDARGQRRRYAVDVASARGGPVASRCGIVVETRDLGDAASDGAGAPDL